MNILITGIAGFIGFNLAKYILNHKKNVKIIGIDNLSPYYDRNLKLKRIQQLDNKIKFIECDISNKEILSKKIDDLDFKFVIHLAAQAGVRYSFENPMSYIKTNIEGTVNLLESIKNRKIKHLIFSSTSSIYGKSNSKKAFKETSCSDRQISLYAATKISAEKILHNYSYNFNLPVTILRFFTVYGPWGRPDMALFKFVDSTLQHKAIDVYNHGEIWRDFTYIDDLVKAINIILKIIPNTKTNIKEDTLSDFAPYRVINIGNQKAIKLNDFIDCLENVMQKKILKNYLPMQQGDVPFTLSDSTLLKKLTGFAPSTRIEYGIENFFNWYKDYYKIN